MWYWNNNICVIPHILRGVRDFGSDFKGGKRAEENSDFREDLNLRRNVKYKGGEGGTEQFWGAQKFHFSSCLEILALHHK